MPAPGRSIAAAPPGPPTGGASGEPPASTGLSDRRRPGPRPDPRSLALGGGALLAVLLTAATLSGGCTGQNLLPIETEQEFYHYTSRPDVPVLVYFYKTGCPTCVLLEPGLDQLAEEYRGRAIVAKYRHMHPWFEANSYRVMNQYQVYLVPTVILFVGGQERKRWFSDYYLPHYRRALDQALSETAPQKGGIPPENR